MNWLRSLWLAGWLVPLMALAAAPDITLPDVDGKAHHVNEFIGRGQWTIVAVWSVDCMICRRELPEVAFFHEDNKSKNAAVLGVSIDGVAERARVRQFIDDNALSFPSLIGDRKDVVRFGGGALRGTPTYLFFSPKGELVKTHVGSMPLSDIERVVGKRQ